MSSKQTVAVLGAGNMGTSVAKILAENGSTVNLWNWEGEKEPLEQIRDFQENKKYLPGVKLPASINICFELSEAVQQARIVFYALPTFAFKKIFIRSSEYLEKDKIMVNLSKGIDAESLDFKCELISKNLKTKLKKNIVTVSGPAIAKQMAVGQFTIMNIAGNDKNAVKKVVSVLQNDYLKLIQVSDLKGLEIAGSLKNVYAVGLGICDGLGYSLNTKSALLTLALAEMSGFIKSFGGKINTAYNLAGLGDLLGTAFATESRNRRFGQYLGEGCSTQEALKKVGQTVEGLTAIDCVLRLAKKKKIKMPFAKAIKDIVENKEKAGEIIKKFLVKI